MLVEERRDVDHDIEQTFGLVPEFFQRVPDYLLPTEWASFSSLYLFGSAVSSESTSDLKLAHPVGSRSSGTRWKNSGTSPKVCSMSWSTSRRSSTSIEGPPSVGPTGSGVRPEERRSPPRFVRAKNASLTRAVHTRGGPVSSQFWVVQRGSSSTSGISRAVRSRYRPQGELYVAACGHSRRRSPGVATLAPTLR